MSKSIAGVPVLLALLLALLLTGCGGGKATLAPEASTLKKEGVLSMSVEWVKDKKKKFDIRMVIRNEAKYPIIIKLGDMQCYRGERQGMLKHTFFNTGERVIDFRVGEQKIFQMVCDHSMKSDGPFRIVIGRVYDNPTNDGATPDKVIAENIDWKAAERD